MFETMGRRPIWLVGMMGAGKPAVGPLLRDLAPEGRLARLETLPAERASACEAAVIAVDTERRTLDAVAEEILRRLDAERLGRESDVERGVHL
jgi:shikimate kinase